MYPLMPLQVVISIEALRTLITPEWPVVCWTLLLRVTVHLLHVCNVATVHAAGHHTVWQSTNHLKLTTRIVNVGKYWPR